MVGPSVGAPEGTREGLWVGVVGMAVGRTVGSRDGLWVGGLVGVVVGPRVGRIVGLVVGESEGVLDGVWVGVVVGVVDGTMVGDNVTSEGLWVGVVGMAVGRTVGSRDGLGRTTRRRGGWAERRKERRGLGRSLGWSSCRGGRRDDSGQQGRTLGRRARRRSGWAETGQHRWISRRKERRGLGRSLGWAAHCACVRAAQRACCRAPWPRRRCCRHQVLRPRRRPPRTPHG